MAALTGFAQFVSPGGFLVVEDGCVDIEAMRMGRVDALKRQGLRRRHRGALASILSLRRTWPRGVLPAVADWLATPPGHDFLPRRDLEFYGLTCHPGGLLQRRAATVP
jgi:hypothetical protein